MPVNFLKNIILQKGRNIIADRFVIKKPVSEICFPCVEGFYIFYDTDYMKEQWIFNDGYPAAVLFPHKENRTAITVDGKAAIFKSG